MNLNNGRTGKSIQNIIIGLINQFVIVILSFVSRTIFIHTLGVEYLGMNSLFSDVLNMLSMADLGFGTAMAYSFYKPIAMQDSEKIASLLQFYKKVYRYITAVVISIGILLMPFLKIIVKTDKEIPGLYLYYAISFGGVICTYLFGYKSAIITADQKNYIISWISVIINIIKTLLQIIVLYLHRNYVLYLLIGMIMSFIHNVIIAAKSDKMYLSQVKGNPLCKDDKKEIYMNLKSIVVYKLSSVLLNSTDNIFISWFDGVKILGLYSNYQIISVKFLSVIQIIFSSMTASIGNIIAKEDSKKQHEVFLCIQSVNYIFTGIIVSMFAVLINDLIYVWLGAEYLLGDNLVWVLSFNMYLTGVLQPLFSFREATGIYRKTKYVMFITALLNIILSIILGAEYGLAGVILASCISRIMTYMWYEPWILYKEYFKQSVSKYFISLIANFMLVVFGTSIFRVFFDCLKSNTWPLLIYKSILSGMISVLFFSLIYAKSKGIRYIKQKIKSYLYNKKS